MTPLNVGMYAMIAMGIAGAAVAFFLFATKSGAVRRPLSTAGVAVLLLGVGTFGPSFMDPYGRLLGSLSGTSGTAEDSPKYAAFFDEVGKGKATEEKAEVGIAHAINQPVPDMDKLLEKSIKSATSQAGKQRLESALAALKSNEAEADRVIAAAEPKAGATAPPAKPIDLNANGPGVRRLVEHKLAAKPAAELKGVALDPVSKARIDALRTARPR